MHLFLSVQGAIQICLDKAMPENDFSAEIRSPLPSTNGVTNTRMKGTLENSCIRLIFVDGFW